MEILEALKEEFKSNPPIDGLVRPHFSASSASLSQSQRATTGALDPSFVAEYVTDGIITLDSAWRLTYLNTVAQKTACKLLSLSTETHSNSVESLLGTEIWQLLPDSVDGGFFRICRRVMLTGETARFEEYCNLCKSWFEGTVCRYSQGLAVFFRDITERKLSQEVERRLRREIKAISNCHHVLISAEDEKTLLNDICRTLCEKAGYRMAWVGYAQKDDPKAVLPVAWAGFEAGFMPGANSSEPSTKVSSAHPQNTNRQDLRTEDDVAYKKPPAAPWREAAFRRGFLATLVLPLKDDNDRSFGALSIYASETSPFSLEEVRVLEQLSADLSFGICVLRKRIERKRSEENMRKKNFVNTRELLLESDSAEKLRQGALEANEAKSTFLANMSHEIRTPLAAVLGFADLIASGDVKSDDQEKYLAAIHRNGRLLSSIINDLLDLSKVEAGLLDINLQAVPISDILSDLETLLNPLALKKGLALHIRADQDVPAMIHTDPVRLQQILLNIGGNAIKFTEKGSVIIHIRRLVPLKDKRTGIAIAVTDTGIGLSESYADKIFQAFSQADNSLTREHGGPGLGLALARRLAELLGGNVALTESIPGKGSTFTVTLCNCLIDMHGLSRTDYGEAKASLADSSSNLAGRKVLLVEDSVDLRVLVSRYLKTAGAEVETAENGMQALSLNARHDFDMVLMDLQMPIMDGFEALRALRKNGFNRPIIALTAHALKEERERCLDNGFDEHLAKPISRQTLISTLARFSC